MLDGYLEFLEGSVKIVDKDGNDLRNKKVTSNTEVYDKYGNKIVIPAGFKIRVDASTNNADTVTEGIVIEDETGNQFVWIPVGKIYTDIAKTEANAKTITLGRGTFDNGITIIYQPTEENPYTSEVGITGGSEDYKEYQSTSTTTNAKARNINNFYESAIGNDGYYLGRYEAGNIEDTLVCKAKQTVYNNVTQATASSLAQGMYEDGYGSGTFSSDLINSYAWDTAIIFIQTFGYKSNSVNYASTNGLSLISTSIPQATGKNILNVNRAIDEQLNIYDMAGNCEEWSTETFGRDTKPCVSRGSSYLNSSDSAKDRHIFTATDTASNTAFRPILYVAL